MKKQICNLKRVVKVAVTNIIGSLMISRVLTRERERERVGLLNKVILRSGASGICNADNYKQRKQGAQNTSTYKAFGICNENK